MAFHSTCFTVTPSAGTPPYSIDFTNVTLTATVPPTGNVIDIQASLSGAGAPAPYTAAYGAPTDNLTIDLAAGQVISATGPVTLTFDANILAYAGQTGSLAFSGDVTITDAAGCVQTVTIPDGYICPFQAVFQNTAPNCPQLPDIVCDADNLIDYTSPVFTDAEGDPVSLSFVGVSTAPWLTIVDNGDGTFDADGTAPSGANVTIPIIASDGEDECTTSLTITCGAVASDPPDCSVLPSSIDCAGLPFTVSIPNATNVTVAFSSSDYSYVGGDIVANVAGVGGNETATVTATNGNPAQDCTTTIAISECSPPLTVSGLDCPIQISGVSGLATAQTFGPFSPFFGGVAPLTYSATGLPAGVTITSSLGGYIIEIQPNAPATPVGPPVVFDVTVTDSSNPAQTLTCAGNTIEIININP